MTDFILKYWLEFIFGIVTAVLTAAYINVRKKLKRNKIIEQAILAMLHDRLYQACIAYIERGWCDVEDKRNLEYLYAPYKELGGNGTCKQMYEQCQLLPIKETRCG